MSIPTDNSPDTTRDATKFLSWFDINYDDDQPDGSLREINGESADINKGFEGSYVWLIPRKASQNHDMASDISITVGDEDVGQQDLAKGAGGEYRYVFTTKSRAPNASYITDVALWRSSDSQENPPTGWEHISTDINKGRGGDWLYFVWNTQRYIGRAE